jgi:hypothetical protein
MLKKYLVIVSASVALGAAIVMVGWTAEITPSEKLICQISYSSFTGPPVVSPDNMRVAYGVVVGKKQFVVIDGKEEKQYDKISSLSFSSDNIHMAYVAWAGRKKLVVIDGKEEKQYDGMLRGSIIKFNPNGSFNCIALQGNGIYLVTSQGLAKVDSESKVTPNEGKSEETNIDREDGEVSAR